MAKKKDQSSAFEIIVVLSIVFIVAFTGQVLIHYEGKEKTRVGSNGITGFVVGSGDDSAKNEFLDISVVNIEVNPPSPFIGEPFEVIVTVANEGFITTQTPFYVKLELVSKGVDDVDSSPTILYAAMPKNLRPGEEASLSFKIAMIAKEGALKVIASADPTSKLKDKNPANNVRSSTVIITN
jgi:hypothetical protein